MSGILCHFTSEPTSIKKSEEIINSSLIGRQMVVDTHFLGNGHLGLVSTPNSSASVATCNEHKLLVYVDGYFVDAFRTLKTSASWFLSEYLKKGESCISELNGSFNVLVYNLDSDDILIITDRHGTRPLFFVPEREQLSVAYRAEMLAQFGAVEKKLNQNMVANMLSHSRIWFGDQTFYQEVKLLPSKAIVRWSSRDGISISNYSPVSLFDGITPTVEGLARVFKDVMSDFAAIPDVGLSLSGGLDSRILLAAGFKGPTFTWGYRKANDEIKLAEECAVVNGNSWDFVNLNPESFLDSTGEGDVVREGLDLFVQSYALENYPQVVEKGVCGLMTGLALDFTMAGSYTPKSCADLSLDQIVSYLYSKTEYFNSEQREELITSPELKDAVQKVEALIVDSLASDFYKAGAIEALQNFFAEYRVRRWIFQRQMWQRAFLEDYIPTFDNRLVDYLALFSLEQRANHKLFKEVLAELSKSLSDVPYQGTNLPPSAPLEFWQEGTKLEEQKEKLARTVFYETKGNVFVPYNRYYSNFDEWFRVEPRWREAAESLLLSEESLITDFVQPDVVARMLEEQTSGKKTHFGRLIILMSLEKTLRTFKS
ncbi:MAG: hypothetical protein GJ680_00080 [Alteromonadaceae bacterium]|nr:hypothetical protein [Alteromonadaceae bacterium]